MIIFEYKDPESGEVTAMVAGSLESFQEQFCLVYPEVEVSTSIVQEILNDQSAKLLNDSVACLLARGGPNRGVARHILKATEQLIIDAYLKGRKHSLAMNVDAPATGAGVRVSILEEVMGQSGPGYTESGRCLQCGAAKEKGSF